MTPATFGNLNAIGLQQLDVLSSCHRQKLPPISREGPRFLASSGGPLIKRQLHQVSPFTLWRVLRQNARGSNDGSELFLYVRETPVT